MKILTKILSLLIFAFFTLAANSQNARQFFKAGVSFVDADNHRDAIVQFSKALDIDPEYTQAYIERAHCYEQLGDLQNASDDLNRALVFETKLPALYYESARVSFDMKNYKAAQVLAEKCIRLNSKYDPPYRLLSRIYIAEEDFSNSLVSINKALSIKDNAENYFYHALVSEKMKNYNQAETDYNKSISKDNHYLQSYLGLAELSLFLNKTDAALKNCNAVLGLDPANKKAILIRGRVFAKLKDYPKAIEDLSRILVDNPEDKEMYLLRGNYYQEFTQHQNAINDYSRALLIDPKYPEAIYRRAYSYEQTANFIAAIKDYESLASFSDNEILARQYLDDAKKRLFELNRETDPPRIELLEPAFSGDSTIQIARNTKTMQIRGKIMDGSELHTIRINNNEAAFLKKGETFEFTADIDVVAVDFITVTASDAYDNVTTSTYAINRTETDAPRVFIFAPYASDNGEIYLDTDSARLYIEGSIADESSIQSIVIEGVVASYTLDEKNPRFSATIVVANKDRFTVKATDYYGNDTTRTFLLNREGMSVNASNPMGRTWVIFIENSNYDNFPSLDGPSKDVTLMRSSLARYDIHKIIHKLDMSKKEMERFFSIELRDLIRNNKVNTLLIWYAGHGKFISETGYWMPADARRNDEFSYYNLNALRASLQSYTNYITHILLVSDACESGPSFYEAMRGVPPERNCNSIESVKLKSSQVFSSAGNEEAVDNSQFTKAFADILANNPDACIPIETIVDKVIPEISPNRQKPVFGKITGLQDNNGTFFFMLK